MTKNEFIDQVVDSWTFISNKNALVAQLLQSLKNSWNVTVLTERDQALYNELQRIYDQASREYQELWYTIIKTIGTLPD